MDQDTIKKVASLARLHFNDRDLLKMSDKLSLVLKHFQAIETVPTENVEPLVNPFEVKQSFRSDEPSRDITTEEALLNAPLREGNLFKVPPIL